MNDKVGYTHLYIENGKITTDLCRKPTDRLCTYFHHLAIQHIFLTTYLILLPTELYEFAANQNFGMHYS